MSRGARPAQPRIFYAGGSEHEMAESYDSTPWLREMVDEDLQDLFSEEEPVLRKAVRHYLDVASEDTSMECRLVDLLENALELSNDDTSASLWTTVILGELRSERAVGVLLRSLASDEDEALQDAADVALLRIGYPALERLMEAIDSEDDRRLGAPGYRLLGQVGVLQDDGVRERVLDFLDSRLDRERRLRDRISLDALCRSLAFLGDIRQLPRLREILAEDFQGKHPGIQDSIELLEENTAGKAIVGTLAPWEERYGWLFEDDRDLARRGRRDEPIQE